MSDVLLVQMPVASICRPSLALSQLKACLSETSIACNVAYFNIDFADEIGMDMHALLEHTIACQLLGEWLFSAAAFPDFKPNQEAFFQHLRTLVGGKYFRYIQHYHPGVDFCLLFEHMRTLATAFVDRVAEQALAGDPKIVGCTSMFQQNCASLALLRCIKARNPRVVTMMGGANCEGPMGRALHRAFPWVDIVANGEADAYFADLCLHVIASGLDAPAVCWPQGVLTPQHRRLGYPESDAPPRLADLNHSPIPDFDDFFAAFQRFPHKDLAKPVLMMEASRGCWWGHKHHCTFCGLNGSTMAFRHKSPQRVRRELEQQVARFGTTRISFTDNIMPRRFLAELYPGLAETLPDLDILLEIHPHLKPDQMGVLAQAGARWLQPGLESLHTKHLKLMKKGNSALDNVLFLRQARRHGVRVLWQILSGIPAEENAWFEEMCHLVPRLFHLHPPSCLASIHFDRFSPLHNDQAAHGLQLEPSPAYAQVYPLDSEALQNLAYYFEHHGEPLPLLPARQKLSHLIGQWNQLFWNQKTRPRLEMQTREHVPVVLDTRPIATQKIHDLNKISWALLDSCAVPSNAKNLAKIHALPVAVVSNHLSDLCRQNLLVHLDGRFLNLATPACRPLPPRENAPWGFVDYVESARRGGKKSLAEACRPMPTHVG